MDQEFGQSFQPAVSIFLLLFFGPLSYSPTLPFPVSFLDPCHFRPVVRPWWPVSAPVAAAISVAAAATVAAVASTTAATAAAAAPPAGPPVSAADVISTASPAATPAAAPAAVSAPTQKLQPNQGVKLSCKSAVLNTVHYES